MRRWLPCGRVIVSVCLLNATTAAAQSGGPSISASGLATLARSTVVVSGFREAATGTWLGASLNIALGAIILEGVAIGGELSPADNTAALPRDGGEVGGTVRIQTARWLGLEGGYTVRAFDSAAGYQRWTIPSVGVRLASSLGVDGLRGFIRGAYLPSVSVDGQEEPELALAVEAGLAVAPNSVPLLFSVCYRLERYDFPGGSSTRLEQFDQLYFGLGVEFGR